jgi:hypothetical protein
MVQKTVWDVMENRMQDKKYMIDFFENRTSEIINAIAADRLLVYQVSEGWRPLCEFLDVTIPDMAFPNINSRDETKQMLSSLLAASGGQLSDEAMQAAGRKLHGD